MEYTSRKLGRGRVSGEIIAGVEPIEATKRGIDRIVNAGAFPTVCIFRPTIGSEMEDVPPPDPEAMKEVFAHLHQTCRRARTAGRHPADRSVAGRAAGGDGGARRAVVRRSPISNEELGAAAVGEGLHRLETASGGGVTRVTPGRGETHKC